MQSIDCAALSGLLLAGRASELDYLPPTGQTEALDREAWLLTCEPDEMVEAAEFIALSL